MCHRLLVDAKLFRKLLEIDVEIADQVRAEGCRCGGRLHQARYPRKPRGVRGELPAGYAWRLSFCCGTCRRRTTPPSVRFLGRRVYLGVVVVLVCALRQKVGGPTLEEVQAGQEAVPRTTCRWQLWWKVGFPATRFWKGARVRFVKPLGELPLGLVRAFRGWFRDGISRLFGFLSPLTTTSCHAR